MKFEITPSVVAKITLAFMFLAIFVCVFDGCMHEKQTAKTPIEDSLSRVVHVINYKIDSLNYEKSKIPYSRSDSARDEFWK